MNVKNREECFEIIKDAIAELLEEMGEDPGEIELATMLNADLGMTSIDVIHMVVMLEDEVEQPLSFQDLAVRDGEYVQDLSIGQILEFIEGQLALNPVDNQR